MIFTNFLMANDYHPSEFEFIYFKYYYKMEKNCFSSQGFATDRVFMSGHSLGGIILETYIRDHPKLSSGIILFGSYLADGFVGPDDNLFPVPALTVVGTLDGGVLSYVLRLSINLGFETFNLRIKCF